MPRVFISYRRTDSHDIAGRVYDRLAAAIGSENVFKDVDSIQPGDHFPEVIRRAIADCDTVLVFIGTDWCSCKAELGGRRLDDFGDFVRLEVEESLRIERRVIPILVGGASMPSCDDLPPSLHPIVQRNALAVRPDPDFKHDVGRLIAAIGGTSDREAGIDTENRGQASSKGMNVKISAGSIGCMLTMTLAVVFMIVFVRTAYDRYSAAATEVTTYSLDE